MITDAIKQAYKLHRSIIKQMYDSKCTVTEMQSIKDPITKITSTKPVVVMEDVACKLSIQGSPALVASENATQVIQSIKLFLDSSIIIKPGSKIEVTHNGITANYSHSGLPIVLATHQEVDLELFKGWS